MGFRERLGFKGQLDSSGLLDLWENVGSRGIRDHRDLKGPLDLREHKVQRARRVLWGHKDQLDLLDR